MALVSVEGAKLRRTLLWFALIGVAVAIVLFFGGTLVGTFLKDSDDQLNIGKLEISVQNDADADGTIDPLDPSEHPVGGIDLTITRANNRAETFTTDQAGHATAPNLVAGTYQIGAFVGEKAVAGNISTFEITSGKTTKLELLVNAAGQTLSKISGSIRGDTNTDGKISTDDQPLESIKAQLFSDGTSVAETSTGGNGNYSFEQLMPGVYSVRAENAEQSVLSQVIEIRSQLDIRDNVDFLISGRQTTLRPRIILAQTTATGLAITKLVSDSDEADQEFVTATPGSALEYEISIKALGASTDVYSNVVVKDDYPTGIVIDSVQNNGLDAGSSITWTLGAMNGGQTKVLTYSASVDPDAADDSYENLATVTATNQDPRSDDTTVLVRAAGTGVAQSEESNITGAEPVPSNTNAAGSATSETAPVVGVQGWMLALLATVPLSLILAVLIIGLRRARSGT